MKNPRVIVITGASSGIGAALAEYYAASGVRLLLAGRNVERLEKVASACRNKGADVAVKSIDVGDAAAMKAWLEEVDDASPVDLLIANAGISGGSGGKAVLGEDADQLRRILRINLDGVINSVTPLIERMVARKRGQLAVMSSVAGMRGLPSAPAYSTSKAAVKAYGEALRGWVGKHGVEVSVIMPGYIRTPLTSRNPFPMPFIMDADRAARIIGSALARNKGRIAFPLRMYIPLWVICSLFPAWLGDLFFASLPEKPALESGEGA